MELSPEYVKPFLSDYLMGGWQRDKLEFEKIITLEDGIEATMRVDVGFMPGDGVFHFTVPLAFIGFAQLAIIYSCHDNKLTEKPGEVYITDLKLKCKRTINDIQGIKIRLSAIGKKYMKGGVYYSGDIDVGDGAFTGTGRFVSPLPPDFDVDKLQTESRSQ